MQDPLKRLCEQAAAEQNLQKFLELSREITDLLVHKRRQLERQMANSELRNWAEGLANRANLVAAGRKHDSMNRGWLAIEKLYGSANATLPGAVVGITLKDEPQTWLNIARLAGAIVTACDLVETRTGQCETAMSLSQEFLASSAINVNEFNLGMVAQRAQFAY